MVAVASRQILVIDQQKGLGLDIVRNLEASNQPVLFPSEKELPLDDLVAVQDYFEIYQPVLVIHRPPPLVQLSRTGHFSQLENIVAACAVNNTALLHFSDYHVFGGENKNAYTEEDPSAPLDAYGNERMRWEHCIRQSIDQHLILRLSWVIAADGDNLFTRVLSGLVEGETLALSKNLIGAPTWNSDVLRVVCGIARQVVVGARNWGNFHYCSSDHCSEWDFGMQVLDSLRELRTVDGEIIVRDDKVASIDDAAREPREPASAVLHCRRVLNSFGVHGRTWRQGLKSQINHWLEHQNQGQHNHGTP